jgi:hypothetical protein
VTGAARGGVARVEGKVVASLVVVEEATAIHSRDLHRTLR